MTLALLNGCAKKELLSDNQVNDQPPLKELAPELTADQLVAKALNTIDPIIKTRSLLSAAEIYYSDSQLQQASAALKEMPPKSSLKKLSNQDQFRLLLIHLKLGIFTDDAFHLNQSHELFNPSILDRINIDQTKEIIPLLAEALHRNDQHIDSAIYLIEYSGILNSLDYAKLNEQIWALLRTSDPIDLFNYQYTKKDIDVNAWLELAKQITQNQISLENQFRALQSWKKKWPNHPASIAPPEELKLLANLPESRPTSITLALPLSGTIEHVGKAVSDGFMAAYYDAATRNSLNLPKITFYDTNSQPIDSLLLLPRHQNELIIGPLTKTEVNKLSLQQNFNAPILALNYLDTNQTSSSETINHNLYQFGLNPDIEIIQITEILNHKGYNKIAFIGPENEFGFRLHDLLAIELKKHHGHIIESIFYNEQGSLSNSVAQLLGTDTSITRKRHIQTITGLSLEFQPRRRQDIDAIFMLAKPHIAKQINPLFAYHYGGDIPIYSVSQIHQIDEPKNDLDNIYFVDMPWMLSNTIDIKNSIHQAMPSNAKQYARFYALGADAFALAPRLKLLRTMMDSQLQGHTGTLSIDENGIINRQLELATFKKDKAIIIKE